MLAAVFCGPEAKREAVEVALEDLEPHVAILPAKHHGRMIADKPPSDRSPRLAVTPDGSKPRKPHGFLTVGCADVDALNTAKRAVEKHGWTLRLHHEMPPKPKPSATSLLLADMAQMRAQIAALEARLG